MDGSPTHPQLILKEKIMTRFRDFNEVVDQLIIPIGGIEYTLPLISAANAIKLMEARESKGEIPILNGDLYEWFLGPAWEQMKANGVPTEAILRAAMTGLARHDRDLATAEVYWEAGTDPKAQAQYLESLKKSPTPQTSTAAASTTKRRTSTNGTKTNPKR